MEAGTEARCLRRLIWSPRAQRDLFDIASYYDGIDPTLTNEMLDLIEAAPAPLLDFPLLGAASTGGSRKWRVPRTPFLLFYDPLDDAIEIVTVTHVRSNQTR